MSGRVFAHAALKGDEDVRIAAGQERDAQAHNMGTALGESTAWISPELLTLDKPKVDALLAANQTLRTRFDVELANTQVEADHTLGPEGETLLASVGAPLAGVNAVRGQLVAADIA